MNWYLSALKGYATFSGRASRQEYWMFVLFYFIVGVAFAIIEGMLGILPENSIGPLTGLYMLVTVPPWLAVIARRLHDTGRSG